MISPYGLGNSLVEHTPQIDINNLVAKAMEDLKLRIVEAQVVAQGYNIALTTSKTRFNGQRLWFVCPKCERRVGKLYKDSMSEALGCRLCLGLKYKAQRFKGMIENSPI